MLLLKLWYYDLCLVYLEDTCILCWYMFLVCTVYLLMLKIAFVWFETLFSISGNESSSETLFMCLKFQKCFQSVSIIRDTLKSSLNLKDATKHVQGQTCFKGVSDLGALYRHLWPWIHFLSIFDPVDTL